jgi:hypothetical protein
VLPPYSSQGCPLGRCVTILPRGGGTVVPGIPWAASATFPKVVLIDLSTSIFALVELLVVGIAAPSVSSPGGSSALPPPLPALAPLPIVVAAEGSLEVGRPALGCVGLREKTTPAMVASEVALPAWLAEGSEAEAKEWRRLELASLRGYVALETVKRMLSSFGDAISTARASVTGDFVPLGWVSIYFVVALSTIFCLSVLFVWSLSQAPSCSSEGSGGGTANDSGGGEATLHECRPRRRGRARAF